MAITVNIPSQVKNYANLAAFPASGSLKTIYIAEDTNKTYRWTGTAYVEISATAASTWGAIGGTLSNQTDLQTALDGKVDENATITGATKTKITYDSKGLVTSGADATTADIADSTNKRYVTDANLTVINNTSGTNTGDQTLSGLGGVPTSRTLTINGTTQDLSADRTFTISTGITIGTTAITSGTVGRVLFEGTGNVVSESDNLFWDNTNGRLGIGTSSPTAPLTINYSTLNFANGVEIRNTTSTATSITGLSLMDSANVLRAAFQFIPSTAGNAGSLVNTAIFASTSASKLAFIANSAGVGAARQDIYFNCLNTVTNMYLFGATGNLSIQNGGTHVDAGFRLDVNGTARVQNDIISSRNGNLVSRIDVSNTTSGASSSVAFVATSSAGALWMGKYSATTTTNKTVVANDSYISNLTVGDLAIANDVSTGKIKFAAGGSSTSQMIIGANGNVLINTTTDVASSKLTIESTTQGFLPPRMTTTQKNAITTPATGLMVYDTTLNLMSVYNGTTWITL